MEVSEKICKFIGKSRIEGEKTFTSAYVLVLHWESGQERKRYGQRGRETKRNRRERVEEERERGRERERERERTVGGDREREETQYVTARKEGSTVKK